MYKRKGISNNCHSSVKGMKLISAQPNRREGTIPMLKMMKGMSGITSVRIEWFVMSENEM